MRTWIVVCDASRCRFFMSRGGKEWVKFEEFEHPASRAKGLELKTDRPGRTLQAQAPQKRAGMAPVTDPREVEWERFAHHIMQTLEDARAQDAFDRFILVAPPAFLGYLREEMSEKLEKCLFASLAKDYTQIADEEVAERVVTE
jgi:protein required for attachment to host cells